ncbi:nucleotidyltransferase domain-containing protein [candidate division WOR-3 bacterium]|nr:nucleotidyltransferase domain-containing protein [candidate division WOR-3 bacterium]
MIKDENLMKIKEVIKNIFPDSRIILFGSRSKGKYDSQSDYDILVIVKQNLTIKEKRQYASVIRRQLVEIPIDVIVKTEEDIIYYKDKIGSVTREAVLEGVSL